MNNLALIDEPTVVKNENGQLVLAESVEHNLDLIAEASAIVNEAESKFRSKLLDEMLKADLSNAKVGSYQISVAKGKNSVTFDVDGFIENESDDMVVAFCKTNEQKTFNMERFKAEHPEMYDQYCDVHTSVEVDMKKLQKTMPNVYEKYATEVVSTKAPVLKVSKKEQKQ